MTIDGKISRQSLLLSSFAFQAAWIFVSFWKPLQTGLGTVEQSGLFAGSSFFSGLVICAVYLLFGVAFRPLQKMVEQSGWVLAGAALMTAGSVGRVMLGAQTIGGDVADMVAHVGSAFLLLCWLRAFADYDSDTTFYRDYLITPFARGRSMKRIA